MDSLTAWVKREQFSSGETLEAVRTELDESRESGKGGFFKRGHAIKGKWELKSWSYVRARPCDTTPPCLRWGNTALLLFALRSEGSCNAMRCISKNHI
jgi:hypothetical protein